VTEFVFHGELVDLVPPAWRGRPIACATGPHQTAKHAIEALGVPHTEIGHVAVNGETRPISSLLAADDRVDVFPLAPPQPGGDPPRFIADAHLGRLARYLRFAGCDTLWTNAWDDAELVAIAAREGRVALTCDRALLMHRALAAGCWLRSQQPLAQIGEVARRYGLILAGARPSRCLECNALPLPVAKEEVDTDLLPGTRAGFAEFWRCPGCRRIYWRGSHWRRMRAALAAVDR
jgi:hypothetical protein